MTKLLATDFDNTFRINGKFRDEDLAAVRKWREKGNLFGIVTGRFEPPDDAKYLDVDFVMCCSGGLVIGENGEIEYSFLGSNDTLVGLAKECVRYESRDNLFKVRSEYGIAELRYPDIIKDDFACVRALGRFNQASIYFPDLKRTDYVCDILEKTVKGVNILRNGVNVDIPPAGMNKALGVARYAEEHGIGHDCIYTVGDAMNDYEMLSAFNGYAVSHGSPVLIGRIGKTVSGIAELTELAMRE